jgi:hypothetical protein
MKAPKRWHRGRDVDDTCEPCGESACGFCTQAADAPQLLTIATALANRLEEYVGQLAAADPSLRRLLKRAEKILGAVYEVPR